MRLGLTLTAGRPMHEIADEVAEFESAGLDSVTLGEAYSFDAVSRLGYLAARTSRVELASGILPLYSRSPALIAMSAAGLDYVSGGRFRLGIGSSGPQVVEGFHGLVFDAPLGRTRETLQICSSVWRRERLEHRGTRYTIPLPEGVGTGEGRPLKLIDHPVRDRIPVSVAGIGPRTVEFAAELADGWEPFLFHPGRAADVWGESLAAGARRRPEWLGPLEVIARAPFTIADDVAPFEARVRAHLALYIGGMGSREHNFYNDLAKRYGHADAAATVQDLYLNRRVEEAAAAVP